MSPERVALVVGESLVDVVRTAGGEVTHPGGSAANVAVALARLGRPVRFATSYAEDADGALVAAHLDDSGVQVLGDPRQVPRTSRAVATLDTLGAASYEFDLDWQLAPPRLEPGDDPVVLHVGSIGALLAPGAQEVLGQVRARREDLTVVYDVNARPTITGTGPEVVARVQELAGLAHLVKASDEDLAAVWPELSLTEAMAALLDAGPAAVVVTCGAEGARWVARGSVGRVDPVRVPVADTIGAGDTFSAGLVDALWERGALGSGDALARLGEHEWGQVLGHAARLAAVTVSRPGADPPYRHEVAGRAT